MANQRALKLFIRLSMPLLTLGGFGAIWGPAHMATQNEVVNAAAWSSDHRYLASIVQVYGSTGCGSAESSMVVVQRSSFFIDTGQFVPFCLDGVPGRIPLHWQDAQTLAIDCAGCEQNYVYADQNWGKLHFVYDLDRP